MIRHFVKIYLLIFLSIVGVIIYMYISIGSVQTKLDQNIESLFLSQAKTYAKNIENEIKKTFPHDLIQSAFDNPYEQFLLEEKMELLITPIYKYIYVLYRDKNGNYRYLFDGSKEDKGEFNQKLDVDKKVWDQVYKTKKELYFNQSKMASLWITYLYPICYDEKVQAVIAIDFSMKLPEMMHHTLQPIRLLFIYIFISLSFLIIIVLLQLYFGYKSKKESYIDPLTFAYNRHYLREFSKRVRLEKYAIAMIDIDHFKSVNDNYGHKAGDIILNKIASIIKKQIREEDMLFRFGGEEFLLFIKKTSKNENDIIEVANRIRKSIESEEFHYNDLVLKVTISIGLNLYPHRNKTLNEAIKDADVMLYKAKNMGRNRVVFEKETEVKNESLQSVEMVKEALDEGRVICHFQPIVNLKTEQIQKYEALARLVKKDGSIIPPYLFLESIFQTNIYNDFTKQVLSYVFGKIRETKNTISINLNFSDLANESIFKIVIDELEAHRDLADKLIIELLEYEMISSYKGIKERIDEIRSYGVQIALDDFGSGYANYTIFKEIRVDYLKIDGSIIKDIDRSAVLFDIAKSIKVLADSLDIGIVAEFVHSQEVLQKVKELGIEYGQGFLLGKPDILEKDNVCKNEQK